MSWRWWGEPGELIWIELHLGRMMGAEPPSSEPPVSCVRMALAVMD